MSEQLTINQLRAIYALVRKLTGKAFSGEQLKWLSEKFGTNPDTFKGVTKIEASHIISELKKMEKDEFLDPVRLGIPKSYAKKGGEIGG